MRNTKFRQLSLFRFVVAVILCQCFLFEDLRAQIRALDVYANGDVLILIIDPRGRRLGYDPRTNRDYEEIPGGNIGAAGIDIVAEEGGEADSSQINPVEAMIDDATDGEYTITVLGRSLRFYYINIRARHVVKPITNVADGGIIDSGQTATFRFTYDFNDRTKSKIQKVVEGSSLLQDIDTGFKMGLFKNRGIYTSLRQKAENAIRQHQRGQNKAAVNTLQAFLNEVNAQTEKGLDKDAAAILTEDAQALIQQWQK